MISSRKTKQCYGNRNKKLDFSVLEQVTVSMTSDGDSERLREAVNARPSVVYAKTKLKMGFWNVRTMYNTGKTAQVTNEMRRNRLHILGISECRWTGTGDYNTQTGDNSISRQE